MIVSLDHVNVRVVDLRRTLSFYEDVLGMSYGPVPGCSDIKDNAWIYAANGVAVLHVGTGVVTISGSDAQPRNGSGSVDHVALECSNYDAFRERLELHRAKARYNDIPAAKLRQIFVTDPDGIVLELNFRGWDGASIARDTSI